MSWGLSHHSLANFLLSTLVLWWTSCLSKHVHTWERLTQLMVWHNFVSILPFCRYSSTLALTKQWLSSPPHWHVVPRTSWALPLCSSLSSLPMPSWVIFFLGHKWKTSVLLLNACKLVPSFPLFYQNNFNCFPLFPPVANLNVNQIPVVSHCNKATMINKLLTAFWLWYLHGQKGKLRATGGFLFVCCLSVRTRHMVDIGKDIYFCRSPTDIDQCIWDGGWLMGGWAHTEGSVGEVS